MPIADVNNFYTEIGSLIRQARIQSKISQQLFSQQLGISRASVVNIEKGKQRPSIHLLFEISFITGVDFNSLIPHILPSVATEKNTEVNDWKKIVNDKTTDKITRKAVLNFISSIK